MIIRISNFNELITEVKVSHKSAKTSKIKYHDILGLPGYANLRKIGMTLPIDEPTIFRSSGSLGFLMEKDSIVVINQDLYSKLSNLNTDHDDILHINFASDGTIVYYGLLTKNRHLKYKGRPLNSLENYNWNMEGVLIDLKKVSYSQQEWKLAEDVSTDTARDDNRVNNTIIDAMLDMF